VKLLETAGTTRRQSAVGSYRPTDRRRSAGTTGSGREANFRPAGSRIRS